MNEFGVRVLGIPDCKEALLALVPKLRKRILRNALASGARVYRDDAKRLTPILKTRSKYRNVGTVRNAIKVRTSKQSTRRGDVGVFVNVRPAKGGQRGAKNPNDPFYWRFLEFGTTKMSGRRFLTNATKKTTEVLAKITASLVKSLEKINTPGGTK